MYIFNFLSVLRLLHNRMGNPYYLDSITKKNKQKNTWT